MNTGSPPPKKAFTLIEMLAVIAVIAILTALLLPVLSKAKEKGRRIACLNNVRQMVIGSYIFAEEDEEGRLTGSLLTGGPLMVDDDLNWLYPAYIKNLDTFICPSTRNYIRPDKFFPALVEGVILTRLDDLTDNASNPGPVRGHSYEVFGAWHSSPTYPRKTQAAVLTYRHRKASSGLFGVVAGPSQTWLILDADDLKGPPSPWDNENWPDAIDNHGSAGVNVGFCDGHAEWIPRHHYIREYELSEDAGRTQVKPLRGP